MKLALFTLLFFALFSCRDGGQKKPVEERENQGAAKFEFQEEFHNFGTLKAGEVVAFIFQFKNTGDGDLVIEKAEADCGCLEVRFPEEPVGPGENGQVEMVFNSSGETGQVYKEASLFANVPEKKITLAVAATVENEMINLYSQH